MYVLKSRSCSFTHVNFIIQPDESLANWREPNPSQIDELVKLGFATIGNKGDLKFGNEWNTKRIDEWLQDLLPVVFEWLDILSDDQDEGKYPWQLLKANRSRLQLHHELPDRYDVLDAKGSKSKGWQDSKLFFGKSITLIDQFPN
jgi:hypothetical protein